MKPMVLPLSDDGRAAGRPPASLISFVGSSTRNIICGTPARSYVPVVAILLSRLYSALGGSQSMQAPIAAVTALVLLPIQGGMTAPKPPAGPPAATTRR